MFLLMFLIASIGTQVKIAAVGATRIDNIGSVRIQCLNGGGVCICVGVGSYGASASVVVVVCDVAAV